MIYPLDLREPAKRARCAAWLKVLRDRRLLTLSPQVLNETYWVVRRKPEFAPLRLGIRAYLQDYSRWTTAPLKSDTLADSFLIEDRFGARFWDALLLASANAAGCDYFLSEDLNDGQSYGGVVVVNPFRHAPEDVLGAAPRP
ncbi:MAG TPA: hypothetical protein VHW60_06175 [Caulobacteraceae bacterium]|nr:hypothetical protein [Caulobacteraceae bacterium]